jgi:AcrR family transcriptional regulator
VSKKSATAAPCDLPISDPTSGLHPTALRILDAAKRLLAEKGWNALTLEAIAAEAQVNKASTRYYFGDKAGLLAAIVDEIVLHECAAVASKVTPGASFEERLDQFMTNLARVATNTNTFGGFFDILPHVTRDAELRQRMVYLYDRWFEWNLEWLDLDGQMDPAVEQRLRGLSRLAAAICDGLAVQAIIYGQDHDPSAALEQARIAIAAVCDSVREQLVSK